MCFMKTYFNILKTICVKFVFLFVFLIYSSWTKENSGTCKTFKVKLKTKEIRWTIFHFFLNFSFISKKRNRSWRSMNNKTTVILRILFTSWNHVLKNMKLLQKYYYVHWVRWVTWVIYLLFFFGITNNHNHNKILKIWIQWINDRPDQIVAFTNIKYWENYYVRCMRIV